MPTVNGADAAPTLPVRSVRVAAKLCVPPAPLVAAAFSYRGEGDRFKSTARPVAAGDVAND